MTGIVNPRQSALEVPLCRHHFSRKLLALLALEGDRLRPIETHHALDSIQLVKSGCHGRLQPLPVGMHGRDRYVRTKRPLRLTEGRSRRAGVPAHKRQ
jgi:hypothetical protein